MGYIFEILKPKVTLRGGRASLQKKLLFEEGKNFLDGFLISIKNGNQLRQEKYLLFLFVCTLRVGNGVFMCKSHGSHKWSRSGQQLGLNNNALSCV